MEDLNSSNTQVGSHTCLKAPLSFRSFRTDREPVAFVPESKPSPAMNSDFCGSLTTSGSREVVPH